METAKLFLNGNSQAVRLPKEYRFQGNEVGIKKVGESIILFPKDKEWEIFINGLNGFTDDFFSGGRVQLPDQVRDSL